MNESKGAEVEQSLIRSEYFPEEPRIRIWNDHDSPRKFVLSILCLDTNLCFFKGWTFIPGGGFTDTPLINEFPEIASYGVRIMLWDEQTMELAYEFDHVVGKRNPRSLFSAPPLELTYGSWSTLEYENEYEGLLEPIEGDVIYDLGGNIGAFAGWALLRARVETIYIFEPTKSLIPHLVKTFEDCRPDVKIFPFAITGEDGERVFYEFQNSVANTLLDFNGRNSSFVGESLVQCKNLERFVSDNNLLLPTFIKYDIESSEYESISATSDEFFSKVRCLSIEFHDNTHGKVFELIKRFLHLGFKMKLKKGCSLDQLSGNLLFWK